MSLTEEQARAARQALERSAERIGFEHRGARLVVADPSHGAAVRDLVFEVLVEFGLTIEPESSDRDLFDLDGAYRRQGGVLWYVERGSTMLGTVALLPLSPREIEFRRLYLARQFRGEGLGAALLDFTIAVARDLDYRSIELETASVLESAIRLYVDRGFESRDASASCSLCDRQFVLRLA